MKILEIRRHTMRTKPGAHLSQTGIDLARLVARDTGPFDRVVTSSVPRAIETAIAMGHAVTQEVESLGQVPAEVFQTMGWPSPIADIAQNLFRSAAAQDYAQDLADQWRDVAQRLPVNGRGLLITHGLIIELGLIASLPKARMESWGEAFGYCEGVRLVYDEDCRDAEILRVPDRYRLVEN
jgi:broad specificity phosphatase PhoE